MLSRWPIRYKLLLGVVTLLLIVAALSFNGFQSASAYRRLARTISRRADELPEAAKLTRSVSELRATLSRVRRLREYPSVIDSGHLNLLREEFQLHLDGVRVALGDYQKTLETPELEDPRIGDRQSERDTVRRLDRNVHNITELNRGQNWMLDEVRLGLLDEQLEELYELSNDLPSYLHTRMQAFATEVRGEYRTYIVASAVTSVTALATLVILILFFNFWIFRPLRVLIDGSRRVAGGEFSHRIQLPSEDEVAELATAMNAMTSRFQEIRDDLDQQVQQRTKEVVRSERLASVGFLAAGVAHEINNPMASIAWSAESLESRVQELLPADAEMDDERQEDVTIVYKYLRRIQEEAFRCKGITDKLLDFSRMGDVERQDANLYELTLGVIEMVRHLGKYRSKRIECDCDPQVVGSVNAQEIKQVVLNLITNALDSCDENGVVHVHLRRDDASGQAELIVQDNGCGMTQEVLEHLFEPFFTRRRDGQGTGLGLSITYRIVHDHGGAIQASSSGPGQGSRFRLTLPLANSTEESHEKRQQAA